MISGFYINLEIIYFDDALTITVEYASPKDKRFFSIKEFYFKVITVPMCFAPLLNLVGDVLFLKEVECIDDVDGLPQMRF